MTALAKGSIVTATVVEALDNCILVCVTQGSRNFRGVLFDENNSLISRTPVRKDIEKTEEIRDFSLRERTGVVALHPSPRRTANSRRSGLAQRLILLKKQEEGKKTQQTVRNSLSWNAQVPFTGFDPNDDVFLDCAKSSGEGKSSQKHRKVDRPLKTTKGSPSKPKKSKPTAGVKRKLKNQETCTRPFKKMKGVQEVYYQGKKLTPELKSKILLQPCLVKVCPLNKSIGILNQSRKGTDTGDQSLLAPKTFLNSIIEERITRQFNGEGQNVNKQAAAQIPGVRRLPVDLERFPNSKTFIDGMPDTASLLSGQPGGARSITDTDTVSETVDVLDEETNSATSIIDIDGVSETMDILDEETDFARSIMDIMEQDEAFETAGIVFMDKSPLDNELERTESVFSGKGEADRSEVSAHAVSETTSPVTSALHTETGAVFEQGNELRICQNTPQNSDNELSQEELLNRVTNNFTTDPENRPTLGRQTSTVTTWEADVSVGENATTATELTEDGLASSEHIKVVPERSNDIEQLSNCSESSTATLSIEVKLEPLDMNIREMNPAQKPVTRSDTAHEPPRLSVNDLVWGKVHHGSLWWPGKVLSLSGTINEVGRTSVQVASVAFFKSIALHQIPVTDLSPFRAHFHQFFLPNECGHYRDAVRQALQAYLGTLQA